MVSFVAVALIIWPLIHCVIEQEFGMIKIEEGEEKKSDVSLQLGNI